ncbi:hypothetical protein F4782DRAFT_517907 [Xylaria castorea]|nr:hypothetical protein F4782DRAFT_517907 [Xylaria castorea]
MPSPIMDWSTTTSVINGNYSVKPPHRFSESHPITNTSLSQHRVHSYMATRNGGGDSVTALGTRGVTTDLSVSERRIEVVRSLNDSLTKYQNGSNSGP